MHSYSINGEVRWANSLEAADHFEAKAAMMAETKTLREIEMICAKQGAEDSAMQLLTKLRDQNFKKVLGSNSKSKRMGWFNIDDHTYTESRNYEARTRAQRAQDWKDTQKAGASA